MLCSLATSNSRFKELGIFPSNGAFIVIFASKVEALVPFLCASSFKLEVEVLSVFFSTLYGPSFHRFHSPFESFSSYVFILWVVTAIWFAT